MREKYTGERPAKPVRIAASILACNSAYIGEAVLAADKGGADIIHVDIMDGHYVKNLTFGPQTVKDLKKITELPVDAHLEVSNPHELIEVFAGAGADIITVQMDCCDHPVRALETIRLMGKKAGLAINPGMGIEQLKYLLTHIDIILLMSVEPGFGGQKFEESIFKKLPEVVSMLEDEGLSIPIAVDGGVSLSNCSSLRRAGADILIAGSSIFSHKDIGKRISELRGEF